MSKGELSKYSLSHFGSYALKVSHGQYTYKGETKHNCIYYPPDYYIQIPCGTCFDCLKRKRNEWSVRLLYEIDSHKQNAFVTLTFDEENLKKYKGNYRKPLMLYLDRVRKKLGYRPRYWFVPELGDEIKYTGRLHFHGIFFGTSQQKFSYKYMRECWTYGHSWVGYVKPQTATYCTKYLLKWSIDFKPFIHSSNGIGKRYLESKKHIEKYHVNNFEPKMYIERNGVKYPMSQYYKRKIFSEDTLFCLSLNRLTSYQQFSQKLNGITYSNETRYKLARDSYYLETLRLGLSQKPKIKINYATLCISQSRPSES